MLFAKNNTVDEAVSIIPPTLLKKRMSSREIFKGRRWRPDDEFITFAYSMTLTKVGKENMLKTTPFLLFDGNCTEAMTFYHKCLGGELSLTRLGDSSLKDMLPQEKHHRIINAHLKNGDIDISATDWMASPAFNPVQGNTSAIFVTGKTYDELKVVFDKLAEGADKKRFQELHDMPIGVYGQFYDKYGVQWIFRGEK